MPVFFKSLDHIRPTRSEVVLKWVPPFGKGGLGGVLLKVMHTNWAKFEISLGVQSLPCLHTPIARQALHSSITFNRTRLGEIFENSDFKQAHGIPLTPLPIGEAK